MRSEIVPLQLDELLRELEREFGPLAAAKGLKLRFVRSSAIARTDRLLLRRLLQNLLSNAIKYTSAGGVLVGARRRGARVVVRGMGYRGRHRRGPSGGDLRGVQAPAGRGSAGPRTRPWPVDRAPNRRSSRRRRSSCDPRRAMGRAFSAFASGDFGAAEALRIQGASPCDESGEPCRAAHRRDRQRAVNSLRHAHAARGLGLRLRRRRRRRGMP